MGCEFLFCFKANSTDDVMRLMAGELNLDSIEFRASAAASQYQKGGVGGGRLARLGCEVEWSGFAPFCVEAGAMTFAASAVSRSRSY
jgi:hypothetical protein